MANLEPCHIQNLRNIRNPVNHLWCSIFLRTLSNPGIFRILLYSKPEEYSEPCQASYDVAFSLPYIGWEGNGGEGGGVQYDLPPVVISKLYFLQRN